jgi:cysteine desulfurase
MAVYLDCNATTPLEPRVADAIVCYMTVEYGNAGSRTHEFGLKAKQAVQDARKQISLVLNSKEDEVIFTSGATESNNMSILGLAQYAEKVCKKHIISNEIEHKAVLEPLNVLKKKGFEITFLPPTSGGFIEPESVKKAIRKDTLLVSIMHVNNETGVVQPIREISKILSEYPEIFFHIDAAQGFGKDIETLRNDRIDLISISAHKIYGPKGIGALITRRRNFKRPPLNPLMYGGGQEHGLRPGTLPVHLIAGFGVAAELALRESKKRNEACGAYRNIVLKALSRFNPIFNGDQKQTLPHILNLSFPSLDSEAVMLALKDLIAISSGSACTSQSYEPSHVLKAMSLSDDTIRGALRFSWCHMSDHPDWELVIKTIKNLY